MNWGGVWTAPSDNSLNFEVAISYPEDRDVTIMYTLDASEPTMENGMMYSNPIQICESTVIRAKAFSDGCISIPSTTHSYIFIDREQKLPVISLVIDPKYLYDESIGILAKGNGTNANANYMYDWRRPLNLEYFPIGEDAALNQLCEMRIHGGSWTRTYCKLKSFALYANKRFGTKRFDYEFWPDDKPGVHDNKSFLLRNSGNDFYVSGYCRDVVCQRGMGRFSEVDWQGCSPVLVYINGEYHAMLNLRERSNEDNVYANYDGLEDIDAIENWTELKEGDWKNYNEFQEFYSEENGHSLEEWKAWMDVEEYADMMILAAWVLNTDFPHNNIFMWRPRAEEGKWRWILKDFDFGLGFYDFRDTYRQPDGNFYETMRDLRSEQIMCLDNHLMLSPEYRDLYLNLSFQS